MKLNEFIDICNNFSNLKKISLEDFEFYDELYKYIIDKIKEDFVKKNISINYDPSDSKFYFDLNTNIYNCIINYFNSKFKLNRNLDDIINLFNYNSSVGIINISNDIDIIFTRNTSQVMLKSLIKTFSIFEIDYNNTNYKALIKEKDDLEEKLKIYKDSLDLFMFE